MALREFYSIVKDERGALTFMMQEGLVRRTAPQCTACQRDMSLVKAGRGDALNWRCPVDKGYKSTVRRGSMWENCKFSLCQALELLFLWSYKQSIESVAELTDVSRTSVLHWFSNFRETCTWWLINNPSQIGGPGLVVEVSESLKSRRKRAGSDQVEQNQVFGAVCPVTKDGFLKVIPDTTEATLLSLIERHIAPGSIIHSNRHASYDSIAALPVTPPYQHFVDAASGEASTSHVESFWQSARHSFKALAGVADTTLESHLDEFMWRNIHGKTSHDAWRNIREHIAQRYPTP